MIKSILTQSAIAILFAGTLLPTSAAVGDAYKWPTYSSTLNYNFKDAGITYSKPTKDVSGTCTNIAKNANGVYHGEYWAFYHGANKNALVTEASILPMLARFDKDFAYITDTLGWPRDTRVEDGYYSAIYLYGSDACTGSNDNTAKGGWQSWIDGYPAVNASYYPVYSFDPASTYNDKISQQNAMIHEGIHAILTTLGASHVHWFQEGGNTWLQQEMEVRRSNATQYSGMGFLNAGNLMAPFVPIESYSGWLLDGSFGGPGAEGVDAGQGICNWRNMLGGVQYGNLFPTFLGLWVAEGAVPWIWVNIPNGSGQYILESIAAAIGESQTRSIIMEYRAKLALLDMKKWSNEMKTLLNQNVGSTIGCEWTPCAVENVPTWKVTPYAVTTDSSGILIPEERTTPGWSGANVIPLTIQTNATQVKLSLLSVTNSMSLQIAYRATDGTPVYSTPVFGANTATLNLSKAPQSNVVFAIISNTDYDYAGETTRKTHHSYRLKLDAGISAKADPNTKWYNNFNLTYDWDSAKEVTSSNSSSSQATSSSSSAVTSTTITQQVQLSIANDYSGTSINLDYEAIASALGISASAITASMISGINEDGSLYVGNTANGDAGHWFSANGDVVNWNANTAYIFSEWNINAKTVSIGHYPNKVLAGETYLIRQAVRTGNKQVILEFVITIGSPTGMTMNWDSWQQDLEISYIGGVIQTQYSIRQAGKVKIGIYTGYGALIRNIVNEYHPVGVYAKPIDLKAMNLPKGVYLIQLSYPGHTETRVSISATH